MAEKPPQSRPGEGLGRAIAARRAVMGMKRKDLAAAADLSYPYISEIENGVKVPSEKALRNIAGALQVDYADLVVFGEGLRERTLNPEASMDARRGREASPDANRSPQEYLASGAVDSFGLSRQSIRRLAESNRRVGSAPNPMVGVDQAQPAQSGEAIDEQAVADLVRQGVSEQMDAWVTNVLPSIVSQTVEQVIARMLESEDVPE